MVTRGTAIASGLDALGLDATEERVQRLASLAELLVDEAIPRGFLGPAEGERIVDRHILEGAALSTLLPPGVLVDVGTGAGLPGLVLAVLRSARVRLIESEGRRAAFLRRAASVLGLDAVDVVQGRAEDAGRDPDMRDGAPAVVARALAPPVVAAELCLPFCAVGGTLVLAVGPSVRDHLDRLAEAAGLLAAHLEAVQRLEISGPDASSWVAVIRKVGPGPERFPRRPGVAARRPLVGGRSQRRDGP